MCIERYFLKVISNHNKQIAVNWNKQYKMKKLEPRNTRTFYSSQSFW